MDKEYLLTYESRLTGLTHEWFDAKEETLNRVEFLNTARGISNIEALHISVIEKII